MQNYSIEKSEILDSKNINNSFIKDVVIGTLISGFLAFAVVAGIYPLIMFCAAPGIYYGVKRKESFSIVIYIIPTIMMFLLFKEVGLIYGFIYAGVAYISSRGINRNKMISDRIINSTAFIFAVVIGMLALIKYSSGINLIEIIDERTMDSFNVSIARVREMGIYSTDQIDSIEASSKALMGEMKYIFPATVLIASFCISAVSNAVANGFIRSMTKKIIAPMRISRFRVNLRFSMAAFIMFIVSFIMKQIDPGTYSILTTNLMVIFYVILYLQGIGVIVHWIERSSASRLIKILVIVASILSVYMNTVVSLIGAVDLVFNFRKIREI